jgi:hypothetical protein
MAIGTATIHIVSLVSVSTGEGIVQLTWGNEKGQLSPEEARAHALKILECAESAETDAFVVEFFEKILKSTRDQAIQILMEFRNFREARYKEKAW